MHLMDWIVVIGLCALSMGIGAYYTRRAGLQGLESFFAGGRNLPWWAIGISNAATYQSGNGAFVAILLDYGLVGNWYWWASWIIWMPLVAVVYAVLWRRMAIVTTAELLTLRYGGRPAVFARRVYAVMMFAFAVLIIAYVTGFFAKTVAPLVPMSETATLLTFGAITVLYTILGGLEGSVIVSVVQFATILIASAAFLIFAVPQHGGWTQILSRIESVRPEALQHLPPGPSLPTLTLIMLVIQGFFFAGSPTAGEGMTAQRFMAARSERHAIGGQLFNAFISLSLRVAPLIGWGLIAMSLFWLPKHGPTPTGFTELKDVAYGWGELVKRCSLPSGFVGLLVAAEIAAFMSTLSALVNWGSSFVVNDFCREIWPAMAPRKLANLGRLATAALFAIASVVTICCVQNMISWFLFINSAMVVFLLPLAWFRFFWWRFNVWGELAATVLGLPASVLVWFVLGFQDRPFWQGVGMLFVTSFVLLTLVALLTPPETTTTLARFYASCRPPGFWKPEHRALAQAQPANEAIGRLLVNTALGILACLGLVIVTNGLFVHAWTALSIGLMMTVVGSAWLLVRLNSPAASIDHKGPAQNALR